jgi:putative transposase
MEKGYKFRIYPTKEQVEQIEQTFGACRWVWNHMLELRDAAWQVNKTRLSSADLMRHLTTLKKTTCPWLYEVSNPALQQAIRDLDVAYGNFFRRCGKGAAKKGFPKWKRKWSGRQSYRVPAENGKKACVMDDKHVKLPKLGKVKCRVSRELEGRILSATIRRVPSGKYYVTFVCTDVPEPEMPVEKDQLLGIDVGVGDLIVRSDGVKVENPKHLKASEKRLARAQRKLSRRKGARKGERPSANYIKQRRKVARIHERVRNQRNDTIHKATTDAVRESQGIACESLNVKGMLRNHKSAKSTSDAAMGEMIRQLTYKCQWYGREFRQVDTFFPSTQTCGCCGAISGPKGMPGLHKRFWDCPECGAHHDRDINAARNILRKAYELA